uniref:DUF6534 domain-containing protein n=1 Tax=Mycena chlorophos TaxID=658473 RepID=A0ABQ0M741_MYCCL|nr:predicted protein [Mycena chlorophos]
MGSNLSTIGPAEIAHGPLFIGLFLNVVLYGIMIIQTYMYFLTYTRDKAWTKAFVAVILLLDTLNTVFDFAYLYKCLIKNFGNVEVLARADWLFATDPATTAIIAVAVQLFYAWRVKVLTGNLWLVAAVVGSAFVAFAGGIGTSVEVHLHPYFINFISFKSVVITWLAGSAVADVIITSILVVHLRSHKSGLAGSDLLVDRIIRMTVQTGLATSLCATIDLILYLTDPVALYASCFLRQQALSVYKPPDFQYPALQAIHELLAQLVELAEHTRRIIRRYWVDLETRIVGSAVEKSRIAFHRVRRGSGTNADEGEVAGQMTDEGGVKCVDYCDRLY